jgi:hypothetical protein
MWGRRRVVVIVRIVCVVVLWRSFFITCFSALENTIQGVVRNKQVLEATNETHENPASSRNQIRQSLGYRGSD